MTTLYDDPNAAANKPPNGNGAPTANNGFPPDWDQARQERFVEALVGNATTTRSQLFDALLAKRRKIDEECDYPPPGTETPQLYRELFDRDPIARRVVEVAPKTTFQGTPKIKEVKGREQPEEQSEEQDEDGDEFDVGGEGKDGGEFGGRFTKSKPKQKPAFNAYADPDEKTPFEEDVEALGASLASGGATSWYNKAQGSALIDYCLRADIASGIGSFGLMLLGFDDGKPLSEPVNGAVVTLNVRCADGKCRPMPAPDGWLLKEQEDAIRNACNGEAFHQVWTHNEIKGSRIEPQFRKVPIPALSAEERATLNAWADHRRRAEAWAANSADRVQPRGGPHRDATVDHNAMLDPPPAENKMVDKASDINAEMRDPMYPSEGSEWYGPFYGKSEAAAEKPAKAGAVKLLYIRIFDESLVQVIRYEWNPRSPRFGQPVMYRVSLSDPKEAKGGIGLPLATTFVHWSRVIHVPADDALTSEPFGPPRMKCPLNRILDVRKIFASSAEGYWQSCFTALSLETNPTLTADGVKVDREGLRDMMFMFRNRLRRDIFLEGMSAKTLAPTVVDPTPFILGQIEAICILIGWPKRVFMGSERGELASSQDDAQLNDVIRGRQNLRATPKIVAPLIDRLILVGAVRPPGKDGWCCEWPDLDSMTQMDKAKVALTVTQAITAFAQGDGEAVVSLATFLVKILGWEKEEVEAIIAETMQRMEDEMQEQQALADEHGFEPVPPDGFQSPEPEEPETPLKVKDGERVVFPSKQANNIFDPEPDARTDAEVYAEQRAYVERIVPR